MKKQIAKLHYLFRPKTFSFFVSIMHGAPSSVNMRHEHVSDSMSNSSGAFTRRSDENSSCRKSIRWCIIFQDFCLRYLPCLLVGTCLVNLRSTLYVLRLMPSASSHSVMLTFSMVLYIVLREHSLRLTQLTSFWIFSSVFVTL